MINLLQNKSKKTTNSNFPSKNTTSKTKKDILLDASIFVVCFSF